MLNMKKLIDETDFDNLTELTKNWNSSEEPAISHQSTKANPEEKKREPSNRVESRK